VEFLSCLLAKYVLSLYGQISRSVRQILEKELFRALHKGHSMKPEAFLSQKIQTSALHRSHLRALLNKLDQKTFSCTAYDTAWVGRVVERSNGHHASYPQALAWLRQRQHPDGSWGSNIEYFHDRIISTLSAIVALSEAGDRVKDFDAVSRGEQYIWQNFDNLASEQHDTVGFELLLPVLFEQASQLGLNLPYMKCEKYRIIRAEKLSMIPPSLLYSRKVSSTHSLEFMGKINNLSLLNNLQEENGSYGNSPSATAHVLKYCPDNVPARNYINEVLIMGCGAAMPAHPVEIFNKSWVLYNIELTGNLVDFIDEAHVHIDDLWQSWDNERGVGFARHYPVPDLDDTAVVFKLLWRAGYPVKPNVFLQYEKETHFSCYTFERTPSIGANVHLLDAVGSFLHFEHRPRIVKKIVRFLKEVRQEGAYWSDKWHISPYYITSHAVIALLGFDNNLARDAVQWILSNQRSDGSWGYYCPTAEETAYCLQAIVAFNNHVEKINPAAIEQAAEYLYRQYGVWEMPHMWIEKCLYTPEHIVESTILSALIMSVNI
jgi:halimadienyl-diphosphate synthase